MVKLEPRNIEKLIKASLNEIENDLVITNCQVVNIFSGEVLPANVYIFDGFISHVEYENPDEQVFAKQIYDGKGKYLIPGLIDSHVHIESSLLTPGNFAEMVVPFGTTTVVCDPHEIANVYGREGIKYMLEAGRGLPMRQLIDIPSCVPSVEGLENSGASFKSDDIKEMLKWDGVIGLAEVMDYEGVISSESKISNILKVTKESNSYMQGHAPQVSGRKLSAYLCGGPSTCHESSSIEEALGKYRNGMSIDIRDSNTNRKLSKIVSGIKDYRYLDNICFCTDDRRCNVTLKEGHINGVVRNAIAAGMNPIDALRSATYNVGREIKLEKVGAIAPGYVADLVLIDNLKDINALAVFFEGKLVSENGVITETIKSQELSLENRNSIEVPQFDIKDLKIYAESDENSQIEANFIEYESFTSSITRCVKDNFRVIDGCVSIKDKENTMYAAVINRHSLDTKSVAIVRNFGINKGAIASSVSHDSHNIAIIYDTPENALVALSELINQRGGMVAVDKEKVICRLKLPVAGLMSTEKPLTVAEEVEKMTEANRILGNIYSENPVSRITILSLIVCPQVKLSDLGMIDVETQKIIPVFDR